MAATIKGVAVKQLMNVSVAVQARAPIVARAAAASSVSVPRGLRVARLIDLPRAVTADGRINARGLETGYDNSTSPFRYSGGGPMDPVALQPRAGLYVATQSRHGIYPTLATEGAHYHRPELTAPVEQRAVSLQEIQAYFEPTGFIAPGKKLIVTYQAPELSVWNPLEAPHDVESLLRPELREVNTILRRYMAAQPPGQPDDLLSDRLRHEIARLNAHDPLPLELAMELNDYSISAAIGNACLAAGTSIRFESARRRTVLVPEFMAGAANLVMPMLPGQPTGLTADSIIQFDAASRSFVKQPIYDVNGNPALLQ